MITTVVFDLDDTLYDEIDYCRSGFTAVADLLAEMPSSQPAEHIFNCIWQLFNDGERSRTFNAALEHLGIKYDDKLIGELIKVYRNHIPKIMLPDDSADILRQLKEGRYSLGLLTDGFLPAQKLKVDALGIESHFDCIIYTEELGREYWKPSPAGFEKMMQTLNAAAETIVYVADNEEKDFISPNRLGILTVQLIRSNRLHTGSSAEPDAAAQYVIRKITQLPDLFG